MFQVGVILLDVYMAVAKHTAPVL